MYSLLVLLIECAICIFLKEIGINPVDNALIIVYMIIFSIAYSEDLKTNDCLSKFQMPLLGGYYLRIALLLFDRYGRRVYQLPNSGADSEYFYSGAVAEATMASYRNSGGFIGLFRIVFSIVGTNRMFGQFIVLLFSVIAISVVTIAIDEIDILEVNKVRAITILAFLPNFAILSSIFLRESIVTMFVSISFLYFMRHYRGESVINLLIAYVSILLGMIFHSGVAGVLIGYTVVVLLHDRMHNKNGVRVYNIALALLFGVTAVYLYIQYGDVFYSKMIGIGELSDIGNILDRGGSSYARYVGNSNSISNMIKYTIPRIVFFLYSPFPWQWRGVADIIAFLFSGLYYLYVSVISIRYVLNKNSMHRVDAFNLIIIVLCVTFIYAWGVSNTGTAVRHRDKIVTLFAVLHAMCRNSEMEAL